MATPDAFNPDKWFSGSGSGKKVKTVKNTSSSASDDIGDATKTIGKIAVGGMVAGMALGMAGAFGSMFGGDK
jgi:hypothetical protein